MKVSGCLLILTSIFLLGCSEDDVAEDRTEMNGIFIDSEVAGMNYFTETTRGVTDKNGGFTFVEGETITFLVGDIVLGSGLAKEEMSPISIASTREATIYSREVKNMAAFLQSLDSDSQPSNGIAINSATANAIEIGPIDFSLPIEKILGSLVAEINLKTGSHLSVVYPEEAAQHLATTLAMEYEMEDLAFSNFIPTIESWKIRPSTSVYWIHETNENGLLVSSTMYEKYPNRLVYQQVYEDYNSAQLPTKYDLDLYGAGEFQYSETVQVNYNEQDLVAGIYSTYGGGTWAENIYFLELDSGKKVKEALRTDEEGNFLYREVFTYLPNNNVSTATYYSTETGYDQAHVYEKYAYSYTAFGDFDKVTMEGNGGGYSRTFAYREDHTLQKETKVHPDYLGSSTRIEETFFDEEEKVIRLKITAGDYRTDYVSFFANGDPRVIENYYQDFLFKIVTYNEDRSSVWKVIEQDGSYKLEFRDAENKVSRTEYYDQDGNLLRSE